MPLAIEMLSLSSRLWCRSQDCTNLCYVLLQRLRNGTSVGAIRDVGACVAEFLKHKDLIAVAQPYTSAQHECPAGVSSTIFDSSTTSVQQEISISWFGRSSGEFVHSSQITLYEAVGDCTMLGLLPNMGCIVTTEGGSVNYVDPLTDNVLSHHPFPRECPVVAVAFYGYSFAYGDTAGFVTWGEFTHPETFEIDVRAAESVDFELDSFACLEYCDQDIIVAVGPSNNHDFIGQRLIHVFNVATQDLAEFEVYHEHAIDAITTVPGGTSAYLASRNTDSIGHAAITLTHITEIDLTSGEWRLAFDPCNFRVTSMVWCEGELLIGCIDGSVVIFGQSSARVVDPFHNGFIDCPSTLLRRRREWTLALLASCWEAPGAAADDLMYLLPDNREPWLRSPVSSITCGLPHSVDTVDAPIIQIGDNEEPAAERDELALQIQDDAQWVEGAEERVRDHAEPAGFPAFHGEVVGSLPESSGPADVEDSTQEAMNNTGAGGNNGSSAPNGYEKVYKLRFGSPPEGGDGFQRFRAALLEGPRFNNCRTTLYLHGYSCELPGGALMFVRPEQAGQVQHALEDHDLRHYHVIVAESMEYLVEEILAGVSFQTRPKRKSGARGRSEISCERFATGGGDDSERADSGNTFGAADGGDDDSERPGFSARADGGNTLGTADGARADGGNTFGAARGATGGGDDSERADGGNTFGAAHGGDDSEHPSFLLDLVEERTFLQWKLKPRNAASVGQSTTEAHIGGNKGMNHRRRVAACRVLFHK